MQNKWPKNTQENQDMSAQRMYPGRTHGIQLPKHQSHHKCAVHGI